MDKVDANIESMLKNLGSLVRGSELSTGSRGGPVGRGAASGGSDDPMVEVVASQLVDNCHELFQFVSEVQKRTEVADFDKVHRETGERKRAVLSARADADAAVAELRTELKVLLADLEANYK